MKVVNRWWEMPTNDGVYYATLDNRGVQIWIDDDLVASAPQEFGKSGNYIITLFDGTVIGSTNWLRSVVAITAYGLGSK